VFRFDSMARATFALLASLLCVAGEVLLLGLQYLGVVIVLMMTIEMAVMAVFMIMFMMNPAGLMPMAMLHNTRAAAALCAALFALLATGVLTADWPRATGRPPADPT
ncbi:NADH:ubiquinone oxidoreductase subunit J, partial [Streptomyces sp. NRRL F-6602]